MNQTTRTFEVTSGSTLRCKGWRQEALLRLLENVLAVGEDPDQLIVYAALGRAARDWPSHDAIVRTLKTMDEDHTLVVQSGKPVALLRTHASAPLVVMANCNLIGQWAKAFEDEANLKLFGRGKSGRYVEHNLDGLMRGDFKSRIEGIARAIQTAQLTPNEGRALENRPKHKNPAADELLVQGATVVLGKQPTKRNQPTTPKKTDNGDGNEPEA